MDLQHDVPNEGAVKSASSAFLTPTESAIQATCGDLHTVIPERCSREGVPAAARFFAKQTRTKVTPNWVYMWLRTNGYELKKEYVRKGGEA